MRARTCVDTNAAIAVGAARYSQTPAFGVTPPLLESFSSRGGTPILLNPAGGVLGAPEIRSAPALTAQDGGATTNVGQGFFNSFIGTSAAAPHAAAVAALLQQSAGGRLTPAQIRFALTSTAVDILPAGFDFDSGAGLLDARAALQVTFGLTPPPFLTIARTAPGQAMISWPPTPGFVLQETLNLAPTNWVNSASGGTNPITVPTAFPQKFYRLRKP